MNIKLSSLAAAVALGAWPAGVVADDLVNQDVLADEQFSQELNAPEGAAKIEAFGKDASGILIHGGAAYIVQKLGKGLMLPDGSKVQPNGTVLGTDGSERLMRSSGQMLSLDGAVKPEPFSSNSLPPTTAWPTPNVPGQQDSFATDTDKDVPADPGESRPADFTD